MGEPIKNSLADYNVIRLLIDKVELFAYLFWIAGVLIFVLTLKKGKYTQQFNLFAWTHVFGFIVTFQMSFWFGNIYNGLIWYVLVLVSLTFEGFSCPLLLLSSTMSSPTFSAKTSAVQN